LTNAPVALAYTLSNGTLVINPTSGTPTIAITGPNPRLVTITAKNSSPAGSVISVSAATVTISGVTITGGAVSGANGGGVVNNATLTLNNDEITGNAVTAATLGSAAGGGVYNNGATLNVSNSTVTGNTAATGTGGTGASGGGIANNTGVLNVSNSTITGNTASGAGLGSASGGGISQATGATMVLASVTLNGNTASNALGNATGGNLSLAGTAQAKNTIISGGTANSAQNCTATFTSLGYNLEDKNQCGFTATGDQINTDPKLQPLGASTSGNNFTDVETVAPTSPVIDHGNPAGCTNPTGAALTTDQVANTRGTPCDIGAYETNLPPRVVTAPVISGTPQTGHVLTCGGATFSGLSPITVSFAWLRNGIAIAGATASTYTPAAPDVGQALSCAVTASNVDGTASATSVAVSVALPPLPPFDGVTLLKTRFTLRNSQIILPVMCSRVAIFGCGGIVKVSVAGSASNATAAAKKKKRRRKPSVPHPTTLGTATFKLNNSQTGTIPVLISHDGKLEIASRPHGRQAVTIQILAYDGLGRQKITSYNGEITAPATTKKKKPKRRKR
jgi:hypothetical protein